MSSAARTHLPSATHVGTVELTVSDLGRSRTFYERALGLQPVPDDPPEPGVEEDTEMLLLGVEGEPPLLRLVADLSAPEPPRNSTGLFHFAVLMPSRQDLAVALRRLIEAGVSLDGVADHLVSEALYLHDPDGNGIEIYRDRQREDWPQIDGQLEMANLPLDLDELLTMLPPTTPRDAFAPAGTRMGHVHLKVADLDSAEDFYAGVLGFDVTVKGYAGALFVSAGGYHHHLGLNTWYSRGGTSPALGSIGLRSFDLVLPGRADLDTVVERLEAAGIAVERAPDAAFVRDPSGNGVRLVVH